MMVGRRCAMVMLTLGLVACSRGNQAEPGLKLTSDEKLDAAIVGLWNNGGSQQLAALIDVPFDELLVFPETTPASTVNAAAGQPLLKGTFYQSSAQLFLFRQSGSAVRATMVASDVFRHEVQNARFGPGVSLVAPGNKQLMTLRD